MSDKNTPQEETEIQDKISKEDHEKNLQRIFEERHQHVMGDFIAKTEEIESPVSVAIVIDPETEEAPLVYINGSEYDAAKLMAYVLKRLKKSVLSELDV